MHFTIIFLFYLKLAFSHDAKATNTGSIYNSFSFVTSNKKEFTLSRADSTTNKNKISFSSLFGLHKSAKADEDSKQWYYVHVLNNSLSKLQEHVRILPTDQIVKNTFILYLSNKQIEEISKYCLIKILESSEKIDKTEFLNETDYLYVKTAPGYELSPSKGQFSIDQKISSDSYIVKIDKTRQRTADQILQKKRKVTEIISTIPAVQIVTAYKKPTSSNILNIGLTQKFDQPLTRGGYLNLYKFDRYVHNHGLTGEGQILTIIDEPIDYRHPMFRDDNVEVEFNKEMPNHRKILYYNSKTNKETWKKDIKQDNHGTHTSGTMAGKSLVHRDNHSINHMFDGSAPDAKIIYAGLWGETTGLDLEKVMNDHNSRISSNSWGDDALFVNNLNHEYGSLAQRNPQSLIVFAAGNSGEGEIGYTIYDPAGSKNVLTVAYSNNPIFIGYNQYTLHSIERPDFIVNLFTFSMIKFYEVADFIGTKKGESSIVAIDTRKTDDESVKEACQNVDGHHVVLMFGDSMGEASDYIDKCTNSYDMDGLVVADNASAVEELIRTKEKVAIVYEVLVDNPSPMERGLKSSIGPGNHGIMKPEVMAPGDYIVSASSYEGSSGDDHHCDNFLDCGLCLKTGTSMATPIVSGGAALIAQYFESGKWIEKTKVDGSTLRALVINSAYHPHGKMEPDLVFGHGFLDLSSVLPLEGEFGVQITSQKDKPKIKENGHLSATIHVKSTAKKLQVTLSYLDPMLHEDSPIPLTRDLDIYLVPPVGQIFHGDHLLDDTQHLATNEKIIVDEINIMEGDYTLHVYSNKFFDSSLSKEELYQEFAVVATGDIDNQYITFSEESKAPCTKSDPKHPDRCLCEEDYIGPVCKTKVHHLVDEQSFYAKMNAMEIKRIKFTLKKNITSVKAYQSSIKDYPSVWISPECHLSLSEYEVNGKVGVNGQVETKVPFGTKEICVAVFNNYYRDDAFYHVEVFTDDDCNSDGGSESDKDKGFKGLSTGTVAIILGSCCGVLLILLIIMIILYLKKKKGDKNEDKSQEFSTMKNPLL
ncbi:hypothetical protein M9Y10_035978 [Tritrichomonas musculus]|uniref:Peptidase S8/S53 domain-containing protein n=1 Tax=Tritrichomonas musculus TaxID=1915356 RepID=A0ABR2GVS8_9EUKA